MRWSGATGAIARGKRVSTGCGRKRRSVPAWPWICGVKPKPKAVNKPLPHSIVHGLDKPGVFTTVSVFRHILMSEMQVLLTVYITGGYLVPERSSPDHLIGQQEQGGGHRDPQRLRGLEVDN